MMAVKSGSDEEVGDLDERTRDGYDFSLLRVTETVESDQHIIIYFVGVDTYNCSQ